MTLAPGVYQATVLNHWWKTAQTGTPGLAVTVSLEDEFGGSEEITGTIWMSKNTMAMARGQLRALGFDPDTQHVGDIGASIDLSGNRCEVTLKEKDFRGQVSIEIYRFGKPLPPPTPAQLDAVQTALRAAKKLVNEDVPVDKAPPPKPQGEAVQRQEAKPAPPAKPINLKAATAEAIASTDPPGDDIPFVHAWLMIGLTGLASLLLA